MFNPRHVSAIINTDSKFKTVTVCAMLRRPLLREEATLNALLVNVLSSGCEKFKSIRKISEYTDSMYGAVFSGQTVKKGEYHIMQFCIEILAGEEKLLRQAIKFLYCIMYEPYLEGGGFSKEIFNVECAMQKDAIEEKINDKVEYARLKCIERMCEKEPFGIYSDGYIEDLKLTDRVSLYNYYKKVVAENPLEIVVVGNTDKVLCEGLITDIFGNISNENKMPYISEFIYNRKEVRSYTEHMNISQGRLCIGLRTKGGYKGYNFYRNLLMNEILGGSGNSKLFLNIREKGGFCYDISSAFYRQKGIILIQLGLESNKKDIVLEKIHEQIENMKNGNIEENELEAAKKAITNGYLIMRDYQGAMLNFYYTGYILNDGSLIEDAARNVNRIGIYDITEAAQEMYTDTIYFLKEGE